MALAEAARPRRIFVATAEALDDEMRSRIEKHQHVRDSSWETVEAPLELAAAIKSACGTNHAVVVDCLTLWLSNLMHANRDIDTETNALVSAVTRSGAPLFLVSNEVGLGIVPENELSRRFRDAQGRLNQTIARHCNRVELVAAGLPLLLKG